jgi:hypothetical protein
MTKAMLVLVFGAGVLVGGMLTLSGTVRAQNSQRVFELRTYTTPEGKLGALQARFRDHTRRIFQKHGMTSIGYWVPEDAPQTQNTLIYILAHPSRETAKKNWAEFSADPEWQKVSEESQRDGRIVTKVESTFMDPTDYSPIK